jgi:SAM-dependent methyltransferase
MLDELKCLMEDKITYATSLAGQTDRWDAEYSLSRELVSSKTERPATVVRKYVDSEGLAGVETVLEQGFGLGRNLRFLLENGVREVWGTEVSPAATNLAKDLFQQLGLSEKAKLLNVSADTRLDLPDSYFDLILEIMVMHALNPDQRERELSEIIRLLKPGGRVLLHTLAGEDPAAQALIATNPGTEPGAYWFSNDSGQIFVEKTFAKEELLNLFSPLKPISLELVTTETPFGDNLYRRQYYVGVFEK